jgi:hypothetical protein
MVGLELASSKYKRQRGATYKFDCDWGTVEDVDTLEDDTKAALADLFTHTEVLSNRRRASVRRRRGGMVVPMGGSNDLGGHSARR